MSTTPRNSGYATAIVPLLGGFREFAAAVDPDESGPPIGAEAPRPATLLAASENGTAAMKPAAADLLSNSLRFISTYLRCFPQLARSIRGGSNPKCQTIVNLRSVQF